MKCWNCGTEHELPASNDAFNRGESATIERIKTRLKDEMCKDECDICHGIGLALMIIDDEFNVVES